MKRKLGFFKVQTIHHQMHKIHSEPITITMHTDSTKKKEEKADQILFKLLTEGMEDSHKRDIPPYAIIHIYLK